MLYFLYSVTYYITIVATVRQKAEVGLPLF